MIEKLRHKPIPFPESKMACCRHLEHLNSTKKGKSIARCILSEIKQQLDAIKNIIHSCVKIIIINILSNKQKVAIFVRLHSNLRTVVHSEFTRNFFRIALHSRVRMPQYSSPDDGRINKISHFFINMYCVCYVCVWSRCWWRCLFACYFSYFCNNFIWKFENYAFALSLFLFTLRIGGEEKRRERGSKRQLVEVCLWWQQI